MAPILQHSLLLSTLVLSSLAGPHPHPHFHSKRELQRTCLTAEPHGDLLSHHDYLHHNEHRNDNDLHNSQTIQNRTLQLLSRGLSIPNNIQHLHDPYSQPSTLKRQSGIEPLYTIETYFHLILDSNNSAPGTELYITDQMASDQFAYISNAYGALGIEFVLAGITRSVNDTWARNGDDKGMKTVLRGGSYSTLNVYFHTLLQSNGERGTNVGDIILGFCSLPTPGILPSTPKQEYVLDGCNILSGTMPGSWAEGYNLGGTTVHEIGHWNGLLHPFQDNSCEPTSFGDYVADTPQERSLTTGCPEEKDTCPTSGVAGGVYDGSDSTVSNPYGPAGIAGPDPIHNFMDYSQDSCYTGFSPGQGARMVNLWVLLRMGL